MTWGPKDHRAPGTRRGHVVWKDGEQAQHQNDRDRVTTLPSTLDIIEPNELIARALVTGPGTPFVTKTVLRRYDEAKRIAPILVATPGHSDHVEMFPKGTLVTYLGQIRSPESKWISGKGSVELSVWRYIFVVGSARWIIHDVNTLQPL